MINREDIDHHLDMLNIHRNNIRICLKQLSKHGKKNAPLGLLNTITDEREEIRRIKDILRGNNLDVEDISIDNEDDTIRKSRNTSRFLLITIIIAIMLFIIFFSYGEVEISSMRIGYSGDNYKLQILIENTTSKDVIIQNVNLYIDQDDSFQCMPHPEYEYVISSTLIYISQKEQMNDFLSSVSEINTPLEGYNLESKGSYYDICGDIHIDFSFDTLSVVQKKSIAYIYITIPREFYVIESKILDLTVIQDLGYKSFPLYNTGERGEVYLDLRESRAVNSYNKTKILIEFHLKDGDIVSNILEIVPK
jgi:hypothetical protein